MKKINLTLLCLSLMAGSLTFVGCEGETLQQNTPEAKTQTKTNFKKVVVQNGTMSDELLTFTRDVVFQNTETDSTFVVSIKVQISENDDELHGLEISDNFFVLTGTTLQEIQDELDNVSWGEHADCIQGCWDRHSHLDENGNRVKDKGLGGCRANCWFDTVIKVAEVVSSFVKAL